MHSRRAYTLDAQDEQMRALSHPGMQASAMEAALALHQVLVANTITRMAFAIDFYDLRFISFCSAPTNHEASSDGISSTSTHVKRTSIMNDTHLKVSSLNQKVENSRPKTHRSFEKLAF